MSNKQALALKYRPQSFDDLVEQESIKKILTYQIENKELRNSYLFVGPAGCGKTTSARIFAKLVNEGISNYIELDGASNNSVDDIRKIIEEAKFKDINSKYKVYIIDECHMLSIGAWNAFLKLLEEPPATTIFILCTTDGQKIPKTILSRCQRFDFKRISLNKIVNRLSYICNNENISYELDALEFIARLSEGGMRDSITMLDKCLAYDSHLTLDTVTKALDCSRMTIMVELTKGLIFKKTDDVILITEKIHSDGYDIKLFVKQYLGFILNTIKYFSTGDISVTNLPLTTAKEMFDSFVEKGINIKVPFFNLLNLLINLNESIKWETNAKNLFQAELIEFTIN